MIIDVYYIVFAEKNLDVHILQKQTPKPGVFSSRHDARVDSMSIS